MPIDSKECFAALTEDGQLWEIYQAAQTGGGGGTPSGPAGGDLAGTYPNPTVDGLQGNPVSNAVPVSGQVLQFDGTNWVPGAIPSGGSGGGGVVYFLNFNTAADTPVTNIPQTPNASKELGITAETTATSFTSAILSTASYDLLASFVTDLNVPSATAIPAGLWDFNIWAESTTTNAANHILYKIEVLKYDGVNAPVLLATSTDSYIYDPQDITQYVSSVVLPQTTILATDRIVVYLYGKATQNNNTITFRFGGQYPTHVHSTMPSVTGTGVVKVVNGVFQSPASTIVDSDVSATANIAQTKIANLTTDLAGKVSKSGDTMTGKLIAAADATESKLNIGGSLVSGAPTTLVDGDLWITNQNKLAFRSSGTTINTAGTNQSNTYSQPQTISSTSNAAAVLSASNTGTREVATFTNTVSATSDAVVITNLGSGNSLVVNDDTTPDSTRFAVSNTGRVGVGVTPDATVALSVDTTGIKFGDNTIQTTAAVSGIGGSVGTVDNAVPRADGTGGGTLQGSDIVIDDATTATQNNIAIRNDHSGQTDSALVLTPKGTGALIAGPKPDGTLTGGNARGSKSICLIGDRSAATQVASGSNSVAIGYRATASGTTSLAISGAATATDAVGIRGTASGTGAVGIRGTASGVNSITIQGSASADNTIALGASASASAGACIAIGQNTVANSFGGVAVGFSSTTTSGYAFGSTSAGADKSISIGLNNTATQYSCIAIGRLNNSTGSTDSICIGESNTSSGNHSYSIGATNSSSGQYSLALGSGNAASGDYSNASGVQSSANRYGMVGRANGQFSASGDAQRGAFILRCKTTTNSAVEMALNGAATYLGIPSGKVMSCLINISGVKSDGSAVAHYVRQYAVKNVGGTSSEVYAPVTIGTDNAAGTVIALSANNTDDTLRIAVTGIAAETWRWVASVDAVEIAYGT